MLRARLRLLLALALLFLLIGALPPAGPAAPPMARLLAPQPARAQATAGSSFGSAVACLSAPDQFVTSCFANTLVSDEGISTVASSDTALARFNSGSKAPLATLGQLGAVYGLAYDDGSASGVRRLLLGAFARRMTGFGPGGPGAIYQYNLGSGAVSLFASVPGATDRHAGESNDTAVAQWVGKSSLGDLEIGPSGTTLYALNLDARQIERFDLLTGARLAALPISMSAISADPAVQADLRPFGLEFQPAVSGAQANVYVGLVDSGERSPSTIAPTAYVVAINPVSGAQSTLLDQPLDDPAITGRFDDGANAGHPAWHAWTSTGQGTVWPMPLLADLQWSRDGQLLVLGLRDRNGDVYQADRGPGWWRVQAQGDQLVYRNVGGAWQLQTRAGASTPSDFFGDNFLGAGANTTTAHVENALGALATTLTGSGGGLVEQLVGTTITPLFGGTSGANWYDLDPDAYDRRAAVELVPQGDLWKSATLGDLENLCTVAYIGDRVWRDANGNGVQDAGENGVAGVRLNLLDAGGAQVAQAVTDGAGLFEFAISPHQSYTIELAAGSFGAGQPLSGYVLAPQNRGGDDARDSDADQLTRRVAVPAQSRAAYQMTFDIGVMRASLANGSVGDFVWNDLNRNGLQDGGEPGIANMTVRLLDSAGGVAVATDSTSAAGAYQFDAITPGSYQVEFVPPAAIGATTRNAGANDARDSDADAGTGWRTPVFTVVADTAISTLDLGLLMIANVRVQKSGSAAVRAGDQLGYSIGYANDGPAPALAVTLVDTLPSGVSYVGASPAPTSVSGGVLTWNLGTLPSGSAGTIALTVQTSAALLNGAALVNQARVSTSTLGDSAGDNTASATTLAQRADLSVSKTSTTAFPVLSGGQVRYTLDYLNAGPAAAANVTLTDSAPAQLVGVAWSCASGCVGSGTGSTISLALGALPAGAGGRIVVTASAQTALDRENFTNTATIAGTTPELSTANNQSSAPGAVWTSDLQLIKLAPAQALAGATFTTTLMFQNNGPAPASAVLIGDTLPEEISLVSASPAPTSQDGQALTWSLGALPSQASGAIELVLRAAPALAGGTLVTNRAQIGSASPDRAPANDRASADTLVLARADLAIGKVGPASVRAGDALTYTLNYTNAGPSFARGVVVTDTLPPELEYLDATPEPSADADGNLSWQLGDLGPGASGSIAVRMRSRPTQGVSALPATNRAAIGAATPDPESSDNIGSATTIVQTPDLVLAKSDGMLQAEPGQTLTYTLTVRNTGPISATDVVLVERPPVPLDDPGWTSLGDGSYTLALGAVEAGETITRTATLRLPDPLPPALWAEIRNSALALAGCCADPTPGDNSASDSDMPVFGRVGDLVWNDLDGDGRLGAGEAGLPYAPVELLDLTSGAVRASMRADEQGGYAFDGLRLGRYAVRINPAALAGVYADYRHTTVAEPSAVLDLAARQDDTLDIGLRLIPTTRVALAYLLTEALAPRGYLVRWGTLAEQNTQLFRLERSTRRDRADAVIVGYLPSQGSRGGDYRIVDPSAPSAGPVFYWLYELEFGGGEQRYGPAGPSIQSGVHVRYLPLALR